MPQALDAHPAANFVVLLTHTKLLAFKGLYACRPEEDDTAEHVFGVGPPQVDAAMVSSLQYQTLRHASRVSVATISLVGERLVEGFTSV